MCELAILRLGLATILGRPWFCWVFCWKLCFSRQPVSGLLVELPRQRLVMVGNTAQKPSCLIGLELRGYGPQLLRALAVMFALAWLDRQYSPTCPRTVLSMSRFSGTSGDSRTAACMIIDGPAAHNPRSFTSIR